MFSKEIIESLKSFIRVVLAAIIPLVISQLQENKGIDWRGIAIAASIAGLFAVQDWIHEKDIRTPLDMKGGILDGLHK